MNKMDTNTDALAAVRDEYQQAPLHECTDGLWRALLAQLAQLEARVAQLEATAPAAPGATP
jgi:hypothetical protein